MHIAIVGGGFAGLGAAKHLLEAGHAVTVFERGAAIGGLAQALPVAGTRLEAFYHHVFRSDVEAIALAEELGLGADLRWWPSAMGFFAEGRLHPFGTPRSLLTFQPLSWADKARFGLAILKLQRTRDWRALDDLSAKEWFAREVGGRVYEVCWEPLLRGKFGAAADRISMAWLWGKIALRATNRVRGKQDERLGYLDGSFARLGEALEARVRALGADIRLSAAVTGVAPDGDGVVVAGPDGPRRFDRALLTVPMPVALGLLPADRPGFTEPLAGIRYTGVICTILELDRAFSPYYWINVGDADLPMGGLIEHTNLVGSAAYGGRHLLYLSDYIDVHDAPYTLPDAEVLGFYAPHLRKVNPAFEEAWVSRTIVTRAAHAQPVVEVGYGARKPGYATPWPGVYLANMTHIFPEDRGLNYALKIGREAAAALVR